MTTSILLAAGLLTGLPALNIVNLLLGRNTIIPYQAPQKTFTTLTPAQLATKTPEEKAKYQEGLAEHNRGLKRQRTQATLDSLPIIGVPLGMLSASRPNSRRDAGAQFIGLAALSIPSFLLGALLLPIVARVLRYNPNAMGFARPFEDLSLNLQQMMLPAIVLGFALGYSAYVLLRGIDNHMVEILITLALVAGG